MIYLIIYFKIKMISSLNFKKIDGKNIKLHAIDIFHLINYPKLFKIQNNKIRNIAQIKC
mgnify:CR=1 FL=1